MEQITKRFFNWASILDEQTHAQAEMTSKMPFIYPHLALMPDAHLGKGATVGSVIPTLGAIIPAAVGVDIGCGMIAVRTGFYVQDLEGKDRRALREEIERRIPLSAGRYNNSLTESALVRTNELYASATTLSFDPATYAPNWRLQLGSLGSGNHFIEICADQDDHIWLFLHSGSRGVGNKIAQHHIEVAQKYCEKNWIQLPDKDLAYLVEDTYEFTRYIAEMLWAQDFAMENRWEMMDRVEEAFAQWMGHEILLEMQIINCHHNYTSVEKHFGKQVYLSRKGAIDANPGVWGLIPGSMGTASYVVQGLGNRLALCSAPHGAGREYSRSAARKTFTMEALEKEMEGIEWKHSSEFIDEIPMAYKPIDQVMQDAGDLVEVKYKLRQLINVKGD